MGKSTSIYHMDLCPKDPLEASDWSAFTNTGLRRMQLRYMAQVGSTMLVFSVSYTFKVVDYTSDNICFMF